ncbi:MAG TPA: 50S ribosomal protein L11 methyltransferase [Prolixibacteraceae bacterium]|nr:50S ribosomal protein L11 methyltransferase [Prolixibacteraceae bacterium]
MEYTKITCVLKPDNETAREILIAELGNAGFESFVETDEAVEAYIRSVDFTPELLMAENFQNNDYFSFQHTAEIIPDQNWNEVWEKNYFEPLLIEDQCMVRAPFHENYPAARYEIIINPRMAFGTGNHETTHLMIKTMLKQELEGKNVLDMGCGSGILSVLASMKGAVEVTAIDTDEWSTNNTLENAGLNHTGNILVRNGDAGLLNDQQFDVILANIQRNVLLQDMPAYRKVLKQGGILIMSGFYMADLDAIKEKAASLGLKLKSSDDRSDWCAACFGF